MRFKNTVAVKQKEPPELCPIPGGRSYNAVKDFGSRIRQDLEILRRAGQSLATSATSFALFLRVKTHNGGLVILVRWRW